MNTSFHLLKSIRSLLQDWEKRKLSQIAEALSISRPTANKYLKELLQNWEISKIWSGAHSTYLIPQVDKEGGKTDFLSIHKNPFPYEEAKLLDEKFFKYDSDGRILKWVEGFLLRCKKRDLNPKDKISAFDAINQQINHYRTQCGLLNVTNQFKIKHQYSALDELFYADAYTRAEFGRGALSEQMFVAKQHQDKQQLKNLISLFYRNLECLLTTFDIDAIALTPPSISRKVQILDLVDQLLDPSIPRIPLIKYSPSKILIPQKSLKRPEDRIQNAKNTIFIREEDIHYNTVLLIDDFVGSGATLNETAIKLKTAWVKKIIGFAFFGNLDLKYEVINEM